MDRDTPIIRSTFKAYWPRLIRMIKFQRLGIIW